MPSHRIERIAEAIREVVSTAVLFHVADPRIQGVTVLRAEVSSDLHNATVYVSLMGSETEQQRALEGLRSARGFLQSRVAARLQTRSTPILSFKVDEGVKRSIEISRLIDQAIASDRRPPESSDEADATEDEADDAPDEPSPESDTGPYEPPDAPDDPAPPPIPPA